MSTKRKRGGFLLAGVFLTLFLFSGVVTAVARSVDSDTPQGRDTKPVTVTVVDTKGQPLVGANVIEKGTTNGGVTNLDGILKINVKSDATLQISFLGYVTQEVRALPETKVVLQEDANFLEDVVVVGYGTQRKVNLTGAVASVDVAKTIESRPITDIARALQGSVPGLIITTDSGELNGALTIRIRGSIGSPNGDSEPLILVDNVELSDITLLNPDDIESISVLKDAASASIYGARGAFGVILITTKSKSKTDHISVKYKYNLSLRTPTKNPEQLPGWQQADINLQGAINSSKGTDTYYNVVGNMRVDETHIQKMKEYWDNYGYGSQFGREMEYGRDFEFRDGGMFFIRTWDWYDEYIKNWSPQQNHSLSVSGGNGKTNYNLGLGYLKEEGMMKINSDSYERYNGSLSINSDISKYVSIRAGAMFTRSDYKEPFSYNSSLYDAMYYLYRWQPMYPYGTFEGKEFRSALTELRTAPQTTTEREYIRLTGGMTITPIKDLTIDIDATYSSIEQRYKSYGTPSLTSAYNVFSSQTSLEELRSSYGEYISSSYDYVYQETGRTENVTANFIATYNKRIGDHEFKAIAGSNLEKSEYKYYYAKRMTLLDPAKPELNMATGDQTVSSDHTWWSVAGFFARLNYSYKDRYLLELNGRYDGSSKFPAGDRFGFFPSMSAGYRISEEPFMASLKPYLSNLKIRASWGEIGNQDIGTDVFISTLSTSTDSWIIDGQQVKSTGAPTIVSESLTWERVTTLDFGLDAGFLGGDLNLTFDWYNRKTSDILTSSTVPSTLGASAPYENLGAITTRGWEIAIDYHHTFGNGLYFGATATLADSKTEVTDWTYNTTLPSYGYSGWWAKSAYKEGMILGDIWGLKFDRFLNESDFNSDGSLKDGIPDQSEVFPSGYQFAPGDVLYKDLNGDGKITKQANTATEGDLTIIGNALPRLQFGLRLEAAWRGFDISMFFQGVGKRELWAGGNQVLPGYTSGEPYYVGAEDYWTTDNQDAFYPRPMVYGQSMTGNYQVNDRYLLNMAYVRLKSFTIGYTLPKKLVEKAKIDGVRVYFTGENLFTIDGVKPDIDPEIGIRISGSSSDARNFGRSYPYQKALSFGVQLSF